MSQEPSTPSESGARPAGDRNRLFVAGAWAAFALLVAVLAFVSLRACALGFMPGLFAKFCEAPPIVWTGADNPDATRLTKEIRDLEKQLAEAKACAVPPPPPPEPEPEPVSCPEPPPDEVVLSIDVSGSMQFCINTSQADEDLRESLLRRAQSASVFEVMALQQRLSQLDSSLTCSPPRRRIDFAKQALIDLASSSRSDAAFVLQSFSECGAPQTHGRYSGSERARMRGSISGLQPMGGTALADAIRGAAAQLRGGRTADSPANIVVVSDGNDSCGGDACAAARAVKRSHPFVKIHVITVGGKVSVARCVADAGGGRVFDARDAGKLAAAISEASGENLPAECRKPRP